MKLQVVAIDQRYEFGVGGQQLNNYLVMRLPNGKEARASIDSATAKDLLALDAEVSSESPSDPGPFVPDDASEEQVSEDALVDWASLPDHTLSAEMKKAFVLLEVDKRITYELLDNVRKSVTENFSQEDWDQALTLGQPITRKPQVAAPVKQEVAPAPAVGQVQWSNGSPIVASTASRTVPKDDMGYPILSDGSVDPYTSLGGESRDEDGVGSL